MTRARRPSALPVRRLLPGSAAVLIGFPLALACEERVSLGSWGNSPPITSPSVQEPAGGAPPISAGGALAAGGTSGGVGGAALPTVDAMAPVVDSGPPPPVAVPLPECNATGITSDFSSPSLEIAGTEIWTDWNWGTPRERVSWDLMIERDVPPPLVPNSPIGGYYWHQQFSFVQGVAGRFGLQAEGIYQSDPPDSLVEFTKIAVLWLSGPPLDGELGDIAYPDARVAETSAAGTNWLTIHARFDWEECNVYRLSFGPDETDEDGNVWYAAEIENRTTGELTLLGRMLLPPDAGLLAPYSASRTSPFDYRSLDSCDEMPETSALFGPPRFDTENDFATLTSTRFTEEACPTSRFAVFEQAVRHEVAFSD